MPSHAIYFILFLFALGRLCVRTDMQSARGKGIILTFVCGCGIFIYACIAPSFG